MNIVALFSLVLGISVQAAPSNSLQNNPEWIRYRNYRIHLKTSKDWTIERDLYGMPITVLGPERNGERAVLSVQHTDLTDITLDHAAIAATQKDYFDGRKAWLITQEAGQFLSPIPYQRKIWSNGNDGFEIGVRYKLRGKEFEERSVQLVCNGSIYFIKTLYSSQEPASDRAELQALVNQWNCAPVAANEPKYQESPIFEAFKKAERVAGGGWPNLEDLKKGSPESKIKALNSLIEFYEKMEALQDDDAYSMVSPRPEAKAFAHFKRMMLSLLNPASAAADGKYDCFWAGWPSQYVKDEASGKIHCSNPSDPQSGNSEYAKYAGKCTDEGLLACNPAFFGPDLCISVATPQDRTHATMHCEANFEKDKTRSQAAIVKSFETNKYLENLFTDSVQYAKVLCSDSTYVSSNTGLCTVLEDRLEESFGKETGRTPNANEQDFLNNLSKMRPEEVKTAVKEVLDREKEFEAQCFAPDSGKFLGDQKIPAEGPSCNDRLVEMSDLMNQVEAANQVVASEGAKNSGANAGGAGSSGSSGGKTEMGSGVSSSLSEGNNVCATCDKPVASGPAASTEELINQNECTAAEKKSVAEGECHWKNLGGMDLGCVAKMSVAILKSLKSMVTGFWDLGVMAYHGAKNWLLGSSRIENQTADKAHQASTTTNSLLKELKEDPGAVVTKLFMSIGEGIRSFAQNDLFCRKWSAGYGLGKCEVPGKLECVSCVTRNQGLFCILGGYVIAEFLPELLSGAILAAAEGRKAARLVEGLLESHAGTALKDSARSRMPGLARNAAKNAKVWVQESKVVQKTSSLGKNISTTVKTFKATLSAWIGKFGNFEKTAERLNRLKMTLKAQRGIVGGSVKIASGAYKFGGKAVKNLGKLLTFPLRGPMTSKTYNAVSKFAYERGRYVQSLFSHQPYDKYLLDAYKLEKFGDASRGLDEAAVLALEAKRATKLKDVTAAEKLLKNAEAAEKSATTAADAKKARMAVLNARQELDAAKEAVRASNVRLVAMDEAMVGLSPKTQEAHAAYEAAISKKMMAKDARELSKIKGATAEQKLAATQLEEEAEKAEKEAIKLIQTARAEDVPLAEKALVDAKKEANRARLIAETAGTGATPEMLAVVGRSKLAVQKAEKSLDQAKQLLKANPYTAELAGSAIANQQISLAEKAARDLEAEQATQYSAALAQEAAKARTAATEVIRKANDLSVLQKEAALEAKSAKAAWDSAEAELKLAKLSEGMVVESAEKANATKRTIEAENNAIQAKNKYGNALLARNKLDQDLAALNAKIATQKSMARNAEKRAKLATADAKAATKVANTATENATAASNFVTTTKMAATVQAGEDYDTIRRRLVKWVKVPRYAAAWARLLATNKHNLSQNWMNDRELADDAFALGINQKTGKPTTVEEARKLAQGKRLETVLMRQVDQGKDPSQNDLAAWGALVGKTPEQITLEVISHKAKSKGMAVDVKYTDKEIDVFQKARQLKSKAEAVEALKDEGLMQVIVEDFTATVPEVDPETNPEKHSDYSADLKAYANSMKISVDEARKLVLKRKLAFVAEAQTQKEANVVLFSDADYAIMVAESKGTKDELKSNDDAAKAVQAMVDSKGAAPGTATEAPSGGPNQTK